MIVSNRCQRCGGRLPKGNALGGGCPRCMLELGYETESEVPNGAVTDSIPASIGRYRILRVIGEGGMGIVYEAEQEQPRRTVALKIIKRGIANAEMVWRFEMETEALGRLQHPGIAQIYEAGTVDTGFGRQPYFAMQLIRGQQPREFAEQHQLDTRQRVELMIRICEAVHHAHQRGLIHRDLKPANILVDEDGQPKILDFGVARVTDSDSRSPTETRNGQLIGTLPYMSPEQALADPLELDTRTDVYSLGIIFYELLTGRLPYTVSKEPREAILSIRDDDPASISALNRSYRGDIETIVGMVLEKDKTRRYQSAFGFAIDLRRYLNDEPIAARPPTKSYQLRKFTRRNKTLVAGIAAVFFALLAAVVTVTWMASLLEKVANNTTALSKFVGENVLGLQSADTQQKFGGPNRLNPETTLKQALDSAVQKIDELRDQPLTQATFLEYIADSYIGLGQYREGKDLLERALVLRQGVPPRSNAETLLTTARLASVYVDLKQFVRAETLAEDVIRDTRKIAGDVAPSLRIAVSTLVSIYSRPAEIGDQSRGLPQIDRLLKEVIDDQRRTFGAANPTVEFAIEELFTLYTKSERSEYSDGAAFLKSISEDWRIALTEGSSAALNVEKKVISLYLMPQPQPRYKEAEDYLKLLVRDQRSELGDGHRATQNTINYLVGVYLEQGEPGYSKAADLLTSLLAETHRELGSESQATRNASIGLARVYLKQNRNKEAEALLIPYATDFAAEDAIKNPLDLLKRIAVPDEPYPLSVHTYGGKPADLSDVMLRLTLLEQPTILDVLDRLAQSYDKQGKTAEAQATAKKMKSVLDSVLNSTRAIGGWQFGRPLKRMGVNAIRYIEEGRNAEADAMLKTVLHGYSDVAGQSSNAPEIATLITAAALTYAGKGDNQRAEALLTAIVKADEGGGSREFTLSNSLVRLARWYRIQGRHEDASKVELRIRLMQADSDSQSMFSNPEFSDIGGFVPN